MLNKLEMLSFLAEETSFKQLMICLLTKIRKSVFMLDEQIFSLRY